MTSDRNIGYDAAEPPEAKPKLFCEKCGRGIFEGDSYYFDGREIICERCIENWRETA